MFEESERQSIGKGSKTAAKPAERPRPFDWKSLPVEDLIRYRDEITQTLPPLALKEVNMEEEMLLQFHGLRALQNQVLTDETFPLNQRAQIANTVTSSLTKLTELQETLYRSERHKKIENLLIRCLNKLPEETSELFLAEYEKLLEAL